MLKSQVEDTNGHSTLMATLPDPPLAITMHDDEIFPERADAVASEPADLSVVQFPYVAAPSADARIHHRSRSRIDHSACGWYWPACAGAMPLLTADKRTMCIRCTRAWLQNGDSSSEDE